MAIKGFLRLSITLCAFVVCGAVYGAVCPCPEYIFGKNTNGPEAWDLSGFFNSSVYTLSTDNTASSISVRFAAGGGQARAAIYSDNSGMPGNLIVESADETVAGDGWFNFEIPDTFLAAGTYWLAVQHTAGMTIGVEWTGVAHEWYYAIAYGAFPPVAGAGTLGDGAYDVYVNYCPAVCNTPTNTPTITLTPTITMTFTASPTPISFCDCPSAFGKFTSGPGSANLAGFISMNWYGLYEDRIAMSITIGVISGSGNARVAIYSDTTDVPGEPFMLMSQSASVPVAAGENIIPIPQVYMEQDRVYWIAFQTEGAVNVGGADGSDGDNRYVLYTYGDYPSLAPAMSSHNVNWDLRVNYCPIVCPPTPTPTPTIDDSTMTYTATVTETYTPTDVWTPTQTATLTGTTTNTATHTPSLTVTLTTTPTSLPSATYTVTPTPTVTPQPAQAGVFTANELIVYPNPLNTSNQAARMRLRYSGYAQKAYFSIYTVNMRLVRQYDAGSLSTGEHTFILPPEDAAGLSAGIYHVVVKAQDAAGRMAIHKIENLMVIK